ncbi:Sugar transporter STL1 [Vanrija pseudolonga]|uniref:Sugar transporter STL1 n=1 Tax=Vanrija pseudolonga TaxID=143232 RepID=A0AAF1BMD8_9TREE|nr:Sugar transporter STL1 [Vanrija pseudolonga]
MGFGPNNDLAIERSSAGGLVKYGGLNGQALLVAIVATGTCGFSLFGYDQGLMSGIIGAKTFNDEFPATRTVGANDVYHSTIQGSVTACYEVGCFFGAMFAYFFGDRLGRRRMMLLGCIVMIIGTVITVTAFGPGNPRGSVGGFVQFIIGRVITGLGNGANTATIPSWIAETSKAHNRGFLICLEGSTVAVGTVIAYWMDFGLSYVDSSVNWRFPIAFQIFFALIVVAGVLVLPESPRWLMAKGYPDEALRVLAALRAESPTDEGALLEKEQMASSIEAQARAASNKKSDILKGGKQNHRVRALVGASTQLFQQIGGCNAVIYYSTILFEKSIKLTGKLPLILGGVLAVIYMLFAFLSFTLVEKVGRRNLFLVGTVGQGAAMLITWACLFPNRSLPKDADGNWEALAPKGGAVGLYLFIAFFGATWLPLPWLYPAELNAMAVRTEANAISTMTNWISNFLVVQVLPTMVASIGHWTFFLFFAANVCFLPFIYLWYPETAGRTLEEIDVLYAQAHFEHKRVVKVAAEVPKLSDQQIQILTDRYDIHGSTGGLEAGEVDTSIPSASSDAGHEKAHVEESSEDPSPTQTRVGSVDHGNEK